MTGFYISAANGGYYEGDRAHVLDAEVPQRPSQYATPVIVNGTFQSWQDNPPPPETKRSQPDKIADLLVAKGVITPEERATLFQTKVDGK